MTDDDNVSIEDIFAQYEIAKQSQFGLIGPRIDAIVQSWNRNRTLQGFDAGVQQSHVCSLSCEIEVISKDLCLYGCVQSGTVHICNPTIKDCEWTYTDTEGYEFCMFSRVCVGKAVQENMWTEPNKNRLGGRTNCAYSNISNKKAIIQRDCIYSADEPPSSSSSCSPKTAPKSLSISSPLPRRSSSSAVTPKINMGTSVRSPLATPFRELDLSSSASSGSPLRSSENKSKPIQPRTPFDEIIGPVGSPRQTRSSFEGGEEDPETSSPSSSSSSGAYSPFGGKMVASTPKRAVSSLTLYTTLAKYVPDYSGTTLKGQKRKNGRRAKASATKRDVKRNDWALDVKKRAKQHLKNTKFFGSDPSRFEYKSEWDDDNGDDGGGGDDNNDDEDESHSSGVYFPDTYGGVCLFTVEVPLYRGYSRDIIFEHSVTGRRKGRRSKYSWLGGNFQLKHNSEIETRTDNILDDLLWDNEIKREIYKQKLALSKEMALSEINAYAQKQVENNLLPNYFVMFNRWVHATQNTVKKPILEKVDIKKKTFYRLITLTLWAFMWEYIEVPKWRKKCFNRIKKLETSHVGVISPNQTNVSAQSDVSHIQFTTGLLYTLRQDGLLLDTECVLPCDKWLQDRLPSPADLAFELNISTAQTSGIRNTAPKLKKTVYNTNNYGAGKVSTPASSRPTAAGIGPDRKRKRKKRKRGKFAGYGRGKRSYTQSNITDGRNYVKKGLLKLAQLGHTENIKKAVEVCKKQAESVENFSQF